MSSRKYTYSEQQVYTANKVVWMPDRPAEVIIFPAVYPFLRQIHVAIFALSHASQRVVPRNIILSSTSATLPTPTSLCTSTLQFHRSS